MYKTYTVACQLSAFFSPYTARVYSHTIQSSRNENKAPEGSSGRLVPVLVTLARPATVRTVSAQEERGSRAV